MEVDVVGDLEVELAVDRVVVLVVHQVIELGELEAAAGGGRRGAYEHPAEVGAPIVEEGLGEGGRRELGRGAGREDAGVRGRRPAAEVVVGEGLQSPVAVGGAKLAA